jgi:single-strand DNA-binding protein
MSLNKVILIGNVGRDPEVQHFEGGNAVANFSLATTERGYKLANGTEVPERTEWHRIVVRKDQVSFVERWVKKGSSVYVEGKIRSRSYEDKNGMKRDVYEIVCDKIEFFGSKRSSSGTNASEGEKATTAAFSAPATTDGFDSGVDESDDLPF